MKKEFGTKAAILLVLEFGFMVALPLVVMGGAGKWLELRYNNRLILFAGLILALLSSTVWLFKKISQINKEFTDKDN